MSLNQPTKLWKLNEPTGRSTMEDFYPPLLVKILSARGINTTQELRNFLEASYFSPIPHPVGIQAAVDRILSRLGQEKIMVYGDYDVDGITSTAILISALSSIGADAYSYIPNRFDEGYGLYPGIMHWFKMIHIGLVITVDCGIRSIEEARLAKQLGIDMIVLDHHKPGVEIPEAAAVIDPKQVDDPYPEKNLTAAGLAYLLVLQLFKTHYQRDDSQCSHFLDLVALGTIADVAPLLGQNRDLVRDGLGILRSSKRKGIQSLAKVSRISLFGINSDTVGYTLAPRLNAAGRLETAEAAYQLLITQDANQALELAEKLEGLNSRRQKLTKNTQEHVEKSIDPESQPILFAYHEKYNAGIVGLVAGRLREVYYRPAIIGRLENGLVRASCRSIPEFDITQALDCCGHLMESYGGHAGAAGLTVREKNVPELIQTLNRYYTEQLGDNIWSPSIHIDAELELSEIDFGLVDTLAWLEPTGQGNPKPAFISYAVMAEGNAIGNDGEHLRMVLSDDDTKISAIAFHQGHWAEILPQYINVVYCVEVNDFKDRRSIQLRVLDMESTKF